MINQSKKESKQKVSFGNVDVFHFEREQGHSAVPSQGGFTLGMKNKHFKEEVFSVDRHLAEKEKKKKRHLKNKDRDSSEDFKQLPAIDPSDLQLIEEPQRVNLLLRSGAKLDPIEKIECENIQYSRTKTGCDCTDICRKKTCTCWEAGIHCQVDRPKYPCSCSENGCQNPYGRQVFNHDNVQRHYIKTMTRLNEQRERYARLSSFVGEVRDIVQKKQENLQFSDLQK